MVATVAETAGQTAGGIVVVIVRHAASVRSVVGRMARLAMNEASVAMCDGDATASAMAVPR